MDLVSFGWGILVGFIILLILLVLTIKIWGIKALTSLTLGAVRRVGKGLG
jgi:hypothetical protein